MDENQKTDEKLGEDSKESPPESQSRKKRGKRGDGASSVIPVPEDGIGQRIKEAREALGLTQFSLSNRTKMLDPRGEGISRSVIVGYETGANKPGARELRILCETLHVTPNWLLFQKETPFEAVQASMDFVRGSNPMTTTMQIALATMLLKPHERSLVSSLILSLGGRELGDLRLSNLLTGAALLSEQFRKFVGQEHSVQPNDESVAKFLAEWTTGGSTNWGNKLKLGEDGEVVGGEWLYPDPEAK